MLALCYDLVFLPFVAAFEPPVTVLDTFMTWITLIFWTLDMLVSSITAYYSQGNLVVSRRDILLHYARTWFKGCEEIKSKSDVIFKKIFICLVKPKLFCAFGICVAPQVRIGVS